MTHSFTERRAFAAAHEPFWQAFYRACFPDLLSAYPCPGGESDSQEQGTDRIVHLKSGKLLKIEEKLRVVDYPDFLLEYESGQYQGWIEKPLACDYIAYACIPTGRGCLIPWPLLKLAWAKHKEEWLQKGQEETDGFRLVPGQNVAYTSQSVAVPRLVLYNALNRCSIITVPPELLKELPERETP